MKPIILALLMLIASTASAQLTTDAAYGVSHDAATLKLNYLPDDGGKQYVTIFGHGPRFEAAQKWFDGNAELKRLKDGSHFNCVDTASPMFDRYRSCTPHPLTIRIQQPDGTVISDAHELPLSAEAFVRQCNTDCFRRNRQQPAPVDPPAQPLTPPPPAPAKRQSPAWPAVAFGATLAAIVGGFFGVRSKWQETHI